MSVGEELGLGHKNFLFFFTIVFSELLSMIFPNQCHRV
ncbi:hypothetical protein D082_12230 [Synechocystis sp. PCC 6714]|nr:hypothetical protein D082_12230 [Synechocystis sp. PCC 6714]